MREIRRSEEITVEQRATKPTLTERLDKKFNFLRTAAGGVPRDAWPKGEEPRLGIFPEHPNT